MPPKTDPQIYLIKGRDPVLCAEMTEKVVAQFINPAFRDFDLDRMDARESDAERILAAAGMAPFGSSRRVTVVRNALELPSDTLDALEKGLPSILGTLSVVVFEANEVASKPGADTSDRKRGPARALQVLTSLAKSRGVVQTADTLHEDQARAMIVQMAKDAGIEIQPAAAGQIIERIGLDTGLLRTEVGKLIDYVGPSGQITRADVEAVVPPSAEYSIFRMLDAVAGGQTGIAVATLQGLRGNNEPVQRILAMLSRQFRLIWQARLEQEGGNAVDRMPAEPNLRAQKEFTQRKARAQAKRFDWPDLRRAFRLILQTDLALKGIEDATTDDDETMEMLVVALCRR